jgi:two-component system CheB/CheR fusion protein
MAIIVHRLTVVGFYLIWAGEERFDGCAVIARSGIEFREFGGDCIQSGLDGPDFLSDRDRALIARKTGPASLMDQPWLFGLVGILRQPIVILDELHRVVAASNAFYQLVGATPQSAAGRHLRDVGTGFLGASDLHEFLALIDDISPTLTGFRLEVGKGLSGRRTFILNAQRMGPPLPHGTVLISIEETTWPALPQRSSEESGPHGEEPNQHASSSMKMANHALRQPLQTLSLLQGVLAVKERDPELHKLIDRLQEAIEALTGMLNAMVSTEQINARSMSPEILVFPIGLVINRLRTELAYHAEARGLEWRVAPCRVAVHSDSRLLEQAVRALVIEAMRLIRHGKVLLGCRRRGDMLSIQVWIRGTGVPAEQQRTILDEFHGRNESSKTSLAQTLVKPLSDILGLAVKTRSRPGNGLVFTAEVPIESQVAEITIRRGETSRGTIALISEDPFLEHTLALLLKELGHATITTTPDDGFASLIPNRIGSMQPEIVIVDTREPIEQGVTKTISSLRWALGWDIPAIVLVDNLSKERLVDVSESCVCLPKPVRPSELTPQIARFLTLVRHRAANSNRHDHNDLPQTVFVVDDDDILRDAMRDVLGLQGQEVQLYSSSEDFLAAYTRDQRGCLVIDNMLPGIKGVDLLEQLKSEGSMLPSIMITGHGDISTAVRALKAGAIDYIEKPISYEALLSAVERALEIDRGSADALIKRRDLTARIAELTPRERQVMDLVVSGRSSKQIAQILKISQRTVENHRAAIMKRAGASSLSDLIRTVMQLRLSQDH